MIDYEPLILSKHNIIIEFIKVNGLRLLSVLNNLYNNFVSGIKCFIDKVIEGINTLYYKISPKITYYKNIYKKTFLRINLLFVFLLGIYTIYLYIMEELTYDGLLKTLVEYLLQSIAIEILFYIVVSLALKYYHLHFGYRANLEIDREYTKDFTNLYLPKIAKIYGSTGSGKDELASGLSTFLVDGFISDINDRMEEIRSICYIFDFELIDNVVNQNIDLFYSSRETKTKKAFLILCKEYSYFIKKSYRNKIDLKTLELDSIMLKNNKATYKSPYVYDKGGINKEHYLNMIYDYFMLYTRLVEKHFLFTNQPFLENLEAGEGATIFNLNYLITKSQAPIKLNVKNEFGEKETQEFEEKVLFPFKNYHGFLETEVGTWYINLDKQIQSMLLSMGIRDFKAYNRHFMPNFFWYQVDQDASRASKLFRELDHSYIRIDTREVIDASMHFNKKLERRLNKCDKKINKITKKYYSNITKNYKIDDKIEYLSKLIKASNTGEYFKDKIFDLKDKKRFFNFDKRIKKYEVRRHDTLNQIKLNEYEYGYIVKSVTVCKEPVGSTYDLYNPKNIIDKPELSRGNYSIKMTFKKSDCWRYDTHYMKSVKQTRAERSELNLIDSPTWRNDLGLTKEDVKNMGYIQASELFDIEMMDMLMNHYKKKQ